MQLSSMEAVKDLDSESTSTSSLTWQPYAAVRARMQITIILFMTILSLPFTILFTDSFGVAFAYDSLRRIGQHLSARPEILEVLGLFLNNYHCFGLDWSNIGNNRHKVLSLLPLIIKDNLIS